MRPVGHAWRTSSERQPGRVLISKPTQPAAHQLKKKRKSHKWHIKKILCHILYTNTRLTLWDEPTRASLSNVPCCDTPWFVIAEALVPISGCIRILLFRSCAVKPPQHVVHSGAVRVEQHNYQCKIQRGIARKHKFPFSSFEDSCESGGAHWELKKRKRTRGMKMR